MGLIVASDLDGTFHQTGVETILYLYKENGAYYRCVSMAAFVCCVPKNLKPIGSKGESL